MFWKSLIVLFSLIIGKVYGQETSFLHKVSTLRFGSEYEVATQDSEVDLSIHPSGYLHVQGRVFFVPGKFVDPVFMSREKFARLKQDKEIISAELKLRPYPHPMEGTETTFGTFILRVRNPQSQKLLIDPQRYYHPIKITAVDQNSIKTVMELGELSKSPLEISEWLSEEPIINSFEADGDFLLYVHASSPLIHGKNSLNLSSMLIGSSKNLNPTLVRYRNFTRIIIGAFFLLAVFYGFVYSFRPKDRSSLYLSAYALGMSIASSIYSGLIPVYPDVMGRVVTVLNINSLCFLCFYILHKLEKQIAAKNHKIFSVIVTAIFIINPVSQIFEFGPLISLSFLGIFLTSSYLIILMLMIGIRRRLAGMSYFAIGALINESFQIFVMLTALGILKAEIGFSVILSHFAMAISLGIVNAKEFAVTYQNSICQGQDLEKKNSEISYLNKNLEKLVEQKTSQVRSLLDNIPQGVLSIEDGGEISSDYSAHLKIILGVKDITDETFFDLVLKHSTLSMDEQDQAWQSILAVIGESDIGWEVNSDKLPHELTCQFGDIQKVLEVTWNIKVVDEKIQNILVTLLDITHEKELQRVADEQKEEMILLQELVSVNENSIGQFFATCSHLIEENIRVLESEDTLSEQDLRHLFINAHTVKGAARTLQLKTIATAVHEIENTYSAILKSEAELDNAQLRREMATVNNLFNYCLEINRDKLNRGSAADSININRSLVERHHLLLSKIIEDPTLPISNFLSEIERQSEILNQIVFERFIDVIDEYKKRATKIARDLGKPEPYFDVTVGNINISFKLRLILDNCMTHILRNALDHGIEGREERLSLGKDERGKLKINASLVDGNISLTIEDDGRGLAIAKLREQGLEKGIITEDASVSEIADIIFVNQLSTAKSLSSVSGRGIGMDAIRTYLDGIGGKISLELHDDQASIPEFVPLG